jgi:hypothetical protein
VYGSHAARRWWNFLHHRRFCVQVFTSLLALMLLPKFGIDCWR